jgi:hypothetical protein
MKVMQDEIMEAFYEAGKAFPQRLDDSKEDETTADTPR